MKEPHYIPQTDKDRILADNKREELCLKDTPRSIAPWKQTRVTSQQNFTPKGKTAFEYYGGNGYLGRGFKDD